MSTADEEREEPGVGPEDEPKQERTERRRFQRLGEQLTGLLDPESAFRRGQGIVTGVTQATKEELMRIVSAEVRSFLDKMDAVDLLQQVIAGLTIDVQMQIKFSRSDDDGAVQPKVTRNKTRVGNRDAAPTRTAAEDEPDEQD